jgi:hypothetical protein
LQTKPGVPLPPPELLKRKILVKNKKNDEIENFQQDLRARGITMLAEQTVSGRTIAAQRLDTLASSV